MQAFNPSLRGVGFLRGGRTQPEVLLPGSKVLNLNGDVDVDVVVHRLAELHRSVRVFAGLEFQLRGPTFELPRFANRPSGDPERVGACMNANLNLKGSLD